MISIIVSRHERRGKESSDFADHYLLKGSVNATIDGLPGTLSIGMEYDKRTV